MCNNGTQRLGPCVKGPQASPAPKEQEWSRVLLTRLSVAKSTIESPAWRLNAQTDPIHRSCICKVQVHVLFCQLLANSASKARLFWQPCKSLLPVL